MKPGVALTVPMTPWLYPSKIKATALKTCSTIRRPRPGMRRHIVRPMLGDGGGAWLGLRAVATRKPRWFENGT